MRFFSVFIIFFLNFGIVFSQDENSTYFKIEGDSVFKKEIDLKEVVIYKPVVFADDNERLDYFVLKRKVLKVYPYAKMASERLAKLNDRLDKIKSKRKKKKYTKILEKFIQEELTEELKKLTRTEGQILVKLICRETGSTAYSLVKELRNGFRAFTYNTIAKVFKINLKKEYEPLKVREDLFIENILRNSNL
tara:strand:+ start:279 stop:854 length:576 start_codon:yes stop_codon:yes gene_type:complete